MAFDPGKAKFRVAHEPMPGVIPLPASAGWYDFKPLSSDASNERGVIEDESITGNSQAGDPLDGEIETSAELEMNANAESSAPFFANIQERCDTTSPATDVYVHRLAPSGTDPVAETLALQISRDDGLPQTFREAAVQQFTLAIQRGGVLSLSVSLLSTRADYYGSAVTLVDPAATPAPQIRGIPSYANLTSADGDIFFKITGVANMAATPPSFTGVAKITAAATYGAATFEAPIGVNADGRARWAKIVDSNGANGAGFGLGGDAPEIHFPAATGGAINDEWRFDRERAIWVPAYTTAIPVSAVHAAIYLDGEEYCVESAEISGELPIELDGCIGRTFASKILRRGFRNITLSAERKYTSLAHRKKLEAAKSFLFRLEGYSGVEFEPGYEHAIVCVLPNVRPTGRTADVSDRSTMNETIEGTAYPDPTNAEDYIDDLTIELTNSIPDIAAAI